jgi:hypothetical protein
MPVKLNINGHSNAALFRGRLQARPDGPCNLRIKLLELQSLFLKRNFFEIAVDAHVISIGKPSFGFTT